MKAERKLLFSVTKKDFVITFFSGHGAGGQKRNKTMNCVRIQHPDSGVIVTGQEQRSKTQNMHMAFKRLVNHEKFKSWLKVKASRAIYGEDKLEEELNRIVDEQMREENLKIEYLESVG